MNAPIKLRNLRRPNSTPAHRALDDRYARYESIKRQLTANARTSAEYDAAVREAARLAGV